MTTYTAPRESTYRLVRRVEDLAAGTVVHVVAATPADLIVAPEPRAGTMGTITAPFVYARRSDMTPISTSRESTPSVEWLAEGLAERLRLPDGGFTIHARTREEPTKGFAVAVRPHLSKVLPVAEVTAEVLARYIRRVSAFRDLSVGGWHDPETGLVHLDLSVVVQGIELAFAIGRDKQQLAIFDLAAGQSIPVPPLAA